MHQPLPQLHLGGEPVDDAAHVHPAHRGGSATRVDCDTCVVRGPACGDCVISVLLGPPPELIDDEERRALDVLAAGGLVPPLRLVTPVAEPVVDTA